MSDWVLDASALLAVLHREPGEDRVREALEAGAVVSAVNVSEVVARLADLGMSETDARSAIESFRLEIVSFDDDAAYDSGMLRPGTRAMGLSFGDRACIALGRRMRLPVLTGDRAWRGVAPVLDIEIEIFR